MNMRIESGSTRERIIRNLLMLIMFAFFAVWFAYDGIVGYPNKNQEEHLQQITAQERATLKEVRIYETVTPEALALIKNIVRDAHRTELRTKIEEFFGGPPSFENNEVWYYFGPTFRIQFNLRDGRPFLGRSGNQVLGAQTEKTQHSIQMQKGLGLALGILSIYLMFFLLRVLRTRLVLSDEGLTFNGKGPIRWDDMKALDISRFTAKGWVDLSYSAGDKEETLRLDEYHIAAFDQVIDEICSRKGFENPLPVSENTDDKNNDNDKPSE